MTEHGHPGWYSWLVVIGGCLTSVLISIGVNQQTVSRERAERAAAAERQQQEQAAAAELQRQEDARARAISCAFIAKINQAYESQRDELSEPGQAIAAAWADLKEQCQ